MSTGTSTSSSKIALAIVVIPILIGVWFALPWFLPMWRWQNIDTEKIAREHAAAGVTKAQLETSIDFVVWYHPRKKGDPAPYQIISATPAWKGLGDKFEDEEKLLVRATVISERDGEPISKIWLKASEQENFFKIKGWRFPSGSFGKAKGRPVIVYDGYSLEQVELGAAQVKHAEALSWENDNDWADRDDGFGK